MTDISLWNTTKLIVLTLNKLLFIKIKIRNLGEKMGLREKAKKLKTDIPVLFLCLKDENTPALAKIFAAVTVGYALSPIDLIPDFIPVLGYLDDVILLPALIAITVKLIPKDVWEENEYKAKGMWESGKPKKWYYAIPIVIIWLLIAGVIVKAVCF